MAKDVASGVKEIDASILKLIEERILDAKKMHNGPFYAALDADGTLWDKDAGETFFEWQARNLNLRLPKDPWYHYESLKANDHRIAYVWLAQICAGHPLETVRGWARKCLEDHRPWPVFDSSYKLVTLLKRLGLDIYIVTASVKWAVEPMAELLGINQNHVMGITTEIKEGLVSEQPVHPITWRSGKIEVLLKKFNNSKPIFAAGNTYGDIHMMEAAYCQLAISTQNKHNPLFEEESKLRVEVKNRKWLAHQYRTILF